VSAAAVIELRPGRPRGLAAKLRREDGVGLIELLIALLVLNIGIFATFGAFTSAAVTLRRASQTSTAAAIADQEVEALHNSKYSSIANATISPWPNSPDGKTYTVQVTVKSGQQVTGVTYPGSSSVAAAIVTVYNGSVVDPAKKLVASTTTFSRCTQAGLGPSPDPAATACQS